MQRRRGPAWGPGGMGPGLRVAVCWSFFRSWFAPNLDCRGLYFLKFYYCRIGFVHECVPVAELDARVDKLAAQLAQCGPEALARSKKLLARVAKAPISPKLAAETAAVLADVRAGDEAREGIRSFLEKRRPKWSA